MERLITIANTLINDENWLIDLFKEFPEANVYLVGGIVRDCFLGRDSKDIDLVIERVEKQKLTRFLIEHPDLSVSEVGLSFSVLKVTSKLNTYDVAIPRKDTKVAPGHTGFKVDDVDISILEDLHRRDFTINAMAFNIKTLELIDPYDGQADLEHKLLIPTYPESFIDDPLRILRGFQFSARFGLSPLQYVRTLMIGALPLITDISDERIFDEIRKLSTDVERGIFITFWRQFKVNKYLWPEFNVGEEDTIPQFIESHAETIYHLTDCATPSQTVSFLKKSAIRIKERKEIQVLQKLDYTRPLELRDLFTIVDECPDVRFMKNYAYLHLQDIPATNELLISGEDLVEIGLQPGVIFRDVFNQLRSELMSWGPEDSIRTSREKQLSFIRTLFNQ